MLLLLALASLSDSVQGWILLLALGGWLALLWLSRVGASIASCAVNRFSAVAAAASAALVAAAALLGALLSHHGPSVAPYLVQAAFTVWALAVLIWAAESITRAWHARASLVVVLAAPFFWLLPFLFGLRLSSSNVWLVWTASYLAPLILAWSIRPAQAAAAGAASASRAARRRLRREADEGRAAVVADEREGRVARQSADPARSFRLLLFTAALFVVAPLLVLLASVRVPFARAPAEQSEVAHYGLPTGQLAGASNRTLEELFRPVLRLDPAEKWPEASVSSVLRYVPKIPGACRRDHPCPLELSDNVLSALSRRRPLGSRGAFIRRGFVYPALRAISPQERQRMLEQHQPLAARTHKVIEYWLFYPYDKWNATTALGVVEQSHPSDWEMVGVGLGQDNQPLFVAYSQHCGGLWRPWQYALVVALEHNNLVLTNNGKRMTHPLVTVANGSHANYPTSRPQSPDWLSCKTGSVLRRGAQLLTFMVNATESLTAYGNTQIAPLAPASSAILRHWRWGPDGSSKMSMAGVALPSGDPPRSPGDQPLGKHPLETIFTDTHWSCDSSVPGCP